MLKFPQRSKSGPGRSRLTNTRSTWTVFSPGFTRRIPPAAYFLPNPIPIYIRLGNVLPSLLIQGVGNSAEAVLVSANATETASGGGGTSPSAALAGRRCLSRAFRRDRESKENASAL